ncbi:MAG TPA: Xaa-Pro peptidase family protein [Candidatus Saccharimonadales bacterium]|nr:Xaa-Pro peptidase family protein [Candidatus Saccharimonadales bacterium]
MKNRFETTFFIGNRQKLVELFAGKAPIVLTANGLVQRNSDVTYPFRQDSSFWYLTGLDQPDLTLVIDKGKEYIILPERGRAQQALEADIDPDKLIKQSGIDQIFDYHEGWERLSSRLKRAKHVAVLAPPPAYVGVYNMYTNPARARLVKQVKHINSSLKLLDLRVHLSRLRVIKQPDELMVIQEAIDITEATLKEVQKRLPKYQYEYEVEAAILNGFRKRGANGHAFEPMVAGGVAATSPHQMKNDQPIVKNGVLLIDVGAEIDNYAADLTRTYSIGQPSKRLQAIYKAVESVQDYAFSYLRLGQSLKDYEHAIEHYMGEKLRELGLIKTINHKTVRQYYPHATSHSLGLDVHDVTEPDQIIKPNMVITVEPGIYIPSEEIGVRIEDDVLITQTGIKLMSTLPRELSQLTIK